MGSHAKLLGSAAAAVAGHAGDDDDTARDVLDSIRRIVRALRLSSRAAEKVVGLSAAQLFVLSRLEAEPAMSLNALAERTLTHQSSASVVVTKLVNAGLVRRAQADEDRRRMELSLTAKGRRLLGGAPAAAQDQLITAVQQMPSREQRQLARLLRTFVSAAGMADEPAAMLFEDVSGRGNARAADRGNAAAAPSRHRNGRPRPAPRNLRRNGH